MSRAVSYAGISTHADHDLETVIPRPEDATHATAQLEAWAVRHEPAEFPYGAVLSAYLDCGKHHVDMSLLSLLSKARELVRPYAENDTSRLLSAFLNIALDKFDDLYIEPSYIAVPMLEMPTRTDEEPEWRRDRTCALLIADALEFELTALAGRPWPLPQMRPDENIALKRLKHGLRAIGPALGRLGLADEVDLSRPAHEVCRQTEAVVDAVRADMGRSEHDMLVRSMLPVYVIHDEYFFIRVLQTFETNFALLVVYLRETIDALDAGDWGGASYRLEGCAQTFAEAAPLFSLVATMQVDAFQAFRVYTEGASAIQSLNYKQMESLCRTPDPDRLNSLAYTSVPPVRDRVFGGQRTMWEAFVEAIESNRISSSEAADVQRAMDSLERRHHQWRQTHASLAVHMLGDVKGSGYTEGPPYLKSIIDLPLTHPTDTTGIGYSSCPV